MACAGLRTLWCNIRSVDSALLRPEPVQQVDVRQQRRNHSALRGSRQRLSHHSVFYHPGPQPLPDPLQDPSIRKVALDVCIDYEVRPLLAGIRIASRAFLALFFGLNPKLLASKSVSNLNSVMILAAICTSRSVPPVFPVAAALHPLSVCIAASPEGRYPLARTSASTSTQARSRQGPSFQRLVWMPSLVAGSEVARWRAGHRPHLEWYVRFSRIQLSRRLAVPRCNRRNQLNPVDQPTLAVQLGFRQLSPAPRSASVGINATVCAPRPSRQAAGRALGRRLAGSDAPAPQHRVQFLNQFLNSLILTGTSPGKRAYRIHETPVRFLPGDRVQRLRFLALFA